jgi:hypothetical protein
VPANGSVKTGGALSPHQLRRAIARAERRVQANRPGDELQARRWLKVFRARLERAETDGYA